MCLVACDGPRSRAVVDNLTTNLLELCVALFAIKGYVSAVSRPGANVSPGLQLPLVVIRYMQVGKVEMTALPAVCCRAAFGDCCSDILVE